MFLSPTNKQAESFNLHTHSMHAQTALSPEKRVCCDRCYCQKPCAKRWAIFFFIFGVVLIILAAALPPKIHSLIRSGIRDQLILDGPDATGYAGWQSSFNSDGDKETFSIWMYDIVNPLEILQGQKPYLVEKGPYCYNENKIRFNISFINNTYVQYKEWEYYTWNQECSGAGLREDDEFTSLNIAFQALKAQLRHPSLTLDALYVGKTEEQILFTKHTVKELLWGYFDGVFYAATCLQGRCQDFPGLQTNVSSLKAADAVGFSLIDSGQQDIANVQKFYAYQGSPILQACLGASCPPDRTEPMWYTDEASRIPFVTDGTQFQPFLEEGTPLAAFVDDTNTALNLTNVDNKWETIKGIDMLLYLVSHSNYLNASQSAMGLAHDMFGPMGFLNVTRIEHAMPTFLTNPHFTNTGYDVSQYFQGDVTIQDPAKDLTYVWVEPNLGKTLKATKRLQVSFQIGPVQWTKQSKIFGNATYKFAHLKEMFFPVAWFEEAGTVSDSQASQFKNSVYVAQDFAKGIKYGGAVVGTLLIIYVLYWWWRNVCYPTQPEGIHTQFVSSSNRENDEEADAGVSYVHGGGKSHNKKLAKQHLKQPTSEESDYKRLHDDENVVDDEERPDEQPDTQPQED